MSLEEARRPLALLVERIARLVALIEAAQQRLAFGAIGFVVENAVHERRKAGGKALAVVGQLANQSGQTEQGDERQRGREGLAAKRNRDRLLDQPVSERGEQHGHASERKQNGRGRDHAGPDAGEGEQRPVPQIERIGDRAEEASDAIAERDLARKRMRIGDDQREPSVGIAASQPGKACVSFRNRNAPSISAIPAAAPILAIGRDG